MSLALDCAWIAGHEKEIISSIISINRLKMLTQPESWVEIIMTAEFSIISSISARKSEDNLMSTCLYYITAN